MFPLRWIYVDEAFHDVDNAPGEPPGNRDGTAKKKKNISSIPDTIPRDHGGASEHQGIGSV
jgi:hypothetical protein